MTSAGHETEISDANWLAKVRQDGRFVDIIFSSANGLAPVDDSWFEDAPTTTVVSTVGDFIGSSSRLPICLSVRARRGSTLVEGFCGGFDAHALAPWGEEMIKRSIMQRENAEHPYFVLEL
jgi:hypothetical protein